MIITCIISGSVSYALSYKRIDLVLGKKIKTFNYSGTLKELFSFNDLKTREVFKNKKNQILRDVYLHSAITGPVLLDILNAIKYCDNTGNDPAISSDMEEEINVLIKEDTPRGKILQQVLELAQ